YLMSSCVSRKIHRSSRYTLFPYTTLFRSSDKENKPVVLTTQTIELKPLAKEQAGISRLVLASDVHQTDTAALAGAPYAFGRVKIDRKSTRLNSSHEWISYAVFCLKKKNKT